MPLFSKHNYAIMLRLYRILSFPMNFLLQTSKQPQLVAQGAESIFLKSQSWKVEEFVQYQHRSKYFSFPPKFNIIQMFQLLFLKKRAQHFLRYNYCPGIWLSRTHCYDCIWWCLCAKTIHKAHCSARNSGFIFKFRKWAPVHTFVYGIPDSELLVFYL